MSNYNNYEYVCSQQEREENYKEEYNSSLDKTDFMYRRLCRSVSSSIQLARSLIGYIISEFPRDSYSLQPSDMQHKMLSYFVDSEKIMNPSSMSNSEWLEFIDDGSILYSRISNDTKEDNIRRAVAIVNSLLEHNYTNVTLMDGHGRIVFQILKELSRRGCDVNMYSFIIYELNEDVSWWQNSFLPKGVMIVHDDIVLCQLDNISGVVYLNFNDICYFDKTILRIFLLINKGCSLFVSWSVSYETLQEHTTSLYHFHNWISTMQQNPNNNLRSKFVSQHEHGSKIFYTFEICPFVAEPMNVQISSQSDTLCSYQSEKRRKIVIEDL